MLTKKKAPTLKVIWCSLGGKWCVFRIFQILQVYHLFLRSKLFLSSTTHYNLPVRGGGRESEREVARERKRVGSWERELAVRKRTIEIEGWGLWWARGREERRQGRKEKWAVGKKWVGSVRKTGFLKRDGGLTMKGGFTGQAVCSFRNSPFPS